MRAALVFIFVLVGCNEITQIVHPTSVDVTVGGGTEAEVAATVPVPSGNSIRLDPESLAMRIGDTVVVKVSVFDSQGQELSSAARGTISYSIADPGIVVVSKVDGRWISFQGQNAGPTTVSVTASGVSTTLSVQVSP